MVSQVYTTQRSARRSNSPLRRVRRRSHSRSSRHSRARSTSHSRSHSRSRSRSRSRSQSHHHSSSSSRRGSRSSSPPSSGSSQRRTRRNRSPDMSRSTHQRQAPLSRQEQVLQTRHRNLIRRLMAGAGKLDGLPSADLLSKYTTQAGYIIRGLHLFANINNVFDHGLRAQGYDMAAANIVLEDDEDDDEPGTPADPLEDDSFPIAAEYVKVYERMLKLVPDFPDTMERFKADPTGLNLFINHIRKIARNARGTDTSNLKDAILKYIPKDPQNDTLYPPLPSHAPKSDRGFNHEAIAPLLVPWHQYAEYTADPKSFVTLALNKKKPVITHDSCPLFMYDIEMYDSDDPEQGFGRGYLFIRAVKHLLRGPSAVFQDPDSTKRKSPRSLAKTYRIRELTPQLLAYVACLVRFVLSSKPIWCATDGLFSLRKFYDKVVAFLDDPEDEWVKETMHYLNEQVFGTGDDDDDEPEYIDDPTQGPIDDELKKVLGKREQRRLAREKAAAEEAAQQGEESAARVGSEGGTGEESGANGAGDMDST